MTRSVEWSSLLHCRNSPRWVHCSLSFLNKKKTKKKRQNQHQSFIIFDNQFLWGFRGDSGMSLLSNPPSYIPLEKSPVGQSHYAVRVLEEHLLSLPGRLPFFFLLLQSVVFVPVAADLALEKKNKNKYIKNDSVFPRAVFRLPHQEIEKKKRKRSRAPIDLSVATCTLHPSQCGSMFRAASSAVMITAIHSFFLSFFLFWLVLVCPVCVCFMCGFSLSTAEAKEEPDEAEDVIFHHHRITYTHIYSTVHP